MILPLPGPRIFLSASVPSRARSKDFLRESNAPFEIEQAVIALARAVFAKAGTLVFGGHPSISPLVAIVAGEYQKPRAPEPKSQADDPPPHHSIVIYQSRAFKQIAPEATLSLFERDNTEIIWVEAENGEIAHRGNPGGVPQCPKSVKRMREAMLGEQTLDAMVCIGGMEGVLDEVELFRASRPAKPIYVIGASGGAASILAANSPNVVAIDREIDADLRVRGWAPRSTGRAADRSAKAAGFVEGAAPFDPSATEKGELGRPYDLIMQRLLDRLGGSEW